MRAYTPAAEIVGNVPPATKAAKKELFPIVDRDGIAKPAILLIVEEAIDAGIEQVIIIVQEDDLDDFRKFFTQQISIENYNKLPRHFQEYSRRILDIGRRVTFVVQTTQQGFGHAVWCAKEAVGGPSSTVTWIRAGLPDSTARCNAGASWSSSSTFSP